MSRDRPRRLGHLRLVEVITVRDEKDVGSPESIARLLQVAGQEGATVADLDACVARMHQDLAACVARLREVQRAKVTLAWLPAGQLRAAMELRAKALGGETA